MDQRDHLGEKMRLKELAEEGQYFAARDRELIAKLKQASTAAREQAMREFARARCPQCGEPLHRRSIHEVTISECLTCQGVWIDKAKLADLFPRRGNLWAERFLEWLVCVVERPRP